MKFLEKSSYQNCCIKKKRRLSRFNLMIKMNSSYKKNCRTHGKTKSES